MPAKNEGAESSGAPFQVLAAFPSFKNCVVLFTMFLLCGAVMTTILYVLQLQNNSSLFKAVCDIRMFMVKQDNYSRAISDLQILNQAIDLSKKLNQMKKRTSEMEYALQGIIRADKEHWEQNYEQFYFYSYKKSNFQQAKRTCENYHTRLAILKLEHIRNNLDFCVRWRRVPHWIGLRYNISSKMWSWEDGSVLGKDDTFWNENKGMPQPFNFKYDEDSQNSCAVIGVPCHQFRQCWENSICGEKKHFICQTMMP